MWGILIYAGILALDYAYHRIADSPPPSPSPARRLTVPRTDAGAPYATYYGQCRVQAPVVAWAGNPVVSGDGTTTPFTYSLDQFFAIGIPFFNGTQRLLGLRTGDVALGFLDFDPQNTGDGNLEVPIVSGNSSLSGPPGLVGGQIEFLNGKSTQQLVAGDGTAITYSAISMIRGGVGASGIPGYRGKACALLFGSSIVSWLMGVTSNAPAYSFEVSSFPASPLGPNDRIDNGAGGADANPIDVIYDLLTSPYGKLNLDPARIDLVSFKAAAATLATEKHGFSRSWEDGGSALSKVEEVLRQIYAMMFEDPTTGLLVIRLIRNDYDPPTLPIVSPANCEKIDSFQMSGRTNIPNKMRITYSNRQDAYRDASATAQNQANAAGQDGQTREVQIAMPGVCTQPLADAIASRELAAASTPLGKCRVIVDRTFYQTLPGDVVRLNWPEYGIANVVMRVGNIGRGTLKDGKITLELMQDIYYVWRNQPPLQPAVPTVKSPGSGSFHR